MSKKNVFKLIGIMFVMLIIVAPVAHADREEERDTVTLDENEIHKEEVTINDGYIRVNAESNHTFRVYLISANDIEKYEENRTRGPELTLLDGDYENTDFDQTMDLSQDVYVIFENPGDDSIRIEYSIVWAESDTILWIGALFCGGLLFAIIIFVVLFRKYKKWLWKKTDGWFSSSGKEKDTKTEELEEQIEKLEKELKEAKEETKENGKKKEEGKK